MGQNALETAQRIMDHLEKSKAPNRGISGAIGKMQRREYEDAKRAIANIIEGKPAEGEPEPVAAKSASPAKPKAEAKPAQA